MKTAEDFRRSIGKADEDFLRGIRQTLTVLECEEEQPVKRKISMSLVLALAVMLVTVTALAAGSQGILDFIRERGEEPAVYKLQTDIPQADGDSQWVNVNVQEALIDAGKVYVTMIVQPKEEKTMVIPWIEDISIPDSIAMLQNIPGEGYTSIKAYAANRGFENIVGIYLEEGFIFGKLTDAAYEIRENGALQCVLEYDYSGDTDHPEQWVHTYMNFRTLKYLEDNIKPDHILKSKSDMFQMQAEFRVNICQETRTSQPADAHDIVGFKGVIQQVTMTPMEDGSVQFTMIVDMDDTDETKMYMPVPVLLDETKLWSHMLNGGGAYMNISDKRQWQYTIPAELAQTALADQVVIRVTSYGSPDCIYDQYTYTLK